MAHMRRHAAAREALASLIPKPLPSARKSRARAAWLVERDAHNKKWRDLLAARALVVLTKPVDTSLAVGTLKNRKGLGDGKAE